MGKVYSYRISRDDDRPIMADFHAPEKGTSLSPVLIFLHGFKGFKDWGHWPVVSDFLVRSGFGVLRFNFSWNGTTPEHPLDFADPEAFGRNTFSHELNEVSVVIDDLWMRGDLHEYIDLEKIGIIGHSRGGGIAFLAAQQDLRIKAVAGWAAVSDFEPRVNPPDLEKWFRDGVSYSVNARTKQELPLYFSLREDFYKNKSCLDIPATVKQMRVPQLIVHGTNDEAVSVDEATNLHEWNPSSQLVLIEGANHTFGGKHPWESKEVSPEMAQVIQATTAFFREKI